MMPFVSLWQKRICVGMISVLAAVACAEPWTERVAADELLQDWVLQDAGVKPGETVWHTDPEGVCARAFAKAALPPGASSLAAYRAWCLKRRASRLAPVVAKAKTWVYARHYVMGGSHYAYTEALSDHVAESTFHELGSGLYLGEFTADGLWREVPLLETKEGCFRDVDVSPDAKRLLYAFKANRLKDDFHLYEMDLATRRTRQLTFGLGFADYEGCYLPDGCILFNSSRCSQIVDCYWTEVSNLYRCDADGGNLWRLTFDQVHDNYPVLNADGTIFYTRWEYNDRSQMFVQPFFRMSPDGTGQRAVYGVNSWYPTTLIHARLVENGPCIFAIGTGHHSYQPGELLRIDPREGREEGAGVYECEPFRKATRVKEDAFRIGGRMAMYPYPVNERGVVLSFLPEGWPRVKGRVNYRDARQPFGLYWTDVDGARELLVSRRAHAAPCGRPVPVCARTVTPRPSRRADETLKTGYVYVSDVYAGEAMAGVARGTVKQMRVVEIDYRRVGIGHVEHWGPGGLALCSTPPALGHGSWDVKKVWGEVPVEADGSVAFEAPARVPFYFQLLDGAGHVVQTMRSWTLLQPGEVASCVGCHESANSAPPVVGDVVGRARKGVLKRPARGISFLKDIQPILDRRCVGCHDAAKNPTCLDLVARPVHDKLAKRQWTTSYLSLTHGRTEIVWPWKADSWGVRGKPDHLDLSWIDSASAPPLLKPSTAGSIVSRWFTQRLEKGHCKALTDAERRLLACWVDLGVPFCGDYHEAAVWTPEEEKKWQAAERKHERALATEKR